MPDTGSKSPDADAPVPETVDLVVLCDGAGLRTSLAHAFGPGYADIDPAALAAGLATDRGWTLTRCQIYMSADADAPAADVDWRSRLKALADPRCRLITPPGDPSLRMALDGVQALRLHQADVLMVMGAGASFMALAEDTRRTAREQDRDIRFASAFAPSSHALGRGVPSADHAIAIRREMAERALLLSSGTPRPRRIYAGTSPSRAAPAPDPVSAPQPKGRPGIRLRLAYWIGFATTSLALVWEDVVTAGGFDVAQSWDTWRWGVSAFLALCKSLVWPLYWPARAFGIEAGP